MNNFKSYYRYLIISTFSPIFLLLFFLSPPIALASSAYCGSSPSGGKCVDPVNCPGPDNTGYIDTNYSCAGSNISGATAECCVNDFTGNQCSTNLHGSCLATCPSGDSYQLSDCGDAPGGSTQSVCCIPPNAPTAIPTATPLPASICKSYAGNNGQGGQCVNANNCSGGPGKQDCPVNTVCCTNVIIASSPTPGIATATPTNSPVGPTVVPTPAVYSPSNCSSGTLCQNICADPSLDTHTVCQQTGSANDNGTCCLPEPPIDKLPVSFCPDTVGSVNGCTCFSDGTQSCDPDVQMETTLSCQTPLQAPCIAVTTDTAQ